MSVEFPLWYKMKYLNSIIILVLFLVVTSFVFAETTNFREESLPKSIEEGETITYSLEGTEYVVIALILSDWGGAGGNAKIKLRINGRVTPELSEGSVYYLPDSSKITTERVIPNEGGETAGGDVLIFTHSVMVEISCQECKDCCPCGDGICSKDENCYADSCCSGDQVDISSEYYCGSCTDQCGPGELCKEGKCASRCGDGICSKDETCYADSCCLGNKVNTNSDEYCGSCTNQCDTGEACQNEKCVSHCGDGVCTNGESCSTCSYDCGKCRFCGDGECQRNENCEQCAPDCACRGKTLCINKKCENYDCLADDECNDGKYCTTDDCSTSRKCMHNAFEGCESDVGCLPKGALKNSTFCNGFLFVPKKELNSGCGFNYECETGYCYQGLCSNNATEPNDFNVEDMKQESTTKRVVSRTIEWFVSLFR